MPLTDSYGQGITYPTLTDKPNAQTLGQGIVDNMASKLVMTFASAIVRGATIVKPVAGMVTWLADAGRLEVYDGTNWIAIAAGTTGWNNVTLNVLDGWSTWDDDDKNNHQGTFQYRLVYMFGQATLMFRGGIGRLVQNVYTPPSNGYYTLTMSPLPVGVRPTQLRTLSVPCSDVNSDRITLKMDVRPDGHLRLYGVITKSTPPWVGFNGVMTPL